ncbi:rare lipoprotein A [Aphanothece sacrum FPU3]|nr:rare lipoprotein A [Aphanothece sacrum FPU3]
MAAHPSLPLGTKVKVTNPRNGRSVIVRIVDRCRCSIDLSQGAFRAIGSLGAGRIPVRLKVLR